MVSIFLVASAISFPDCDAQELQPGMYATTATTELVSGPPRIFQDKDCITAQDIASGLTKVGIESDSDCKAQNLTKGGGKITYRLSCEESGDKHAVDVVGTYSADSFNFTIKSVGKNPQYRSLKINGKRIGACK